MRTTPLLMLALLAGCGDKDTAGDDTAAGTDDTGGSEEDSGPAPLAELSSGDCPDLSESGEVSFTSSDMERTAYIVLPEDPQPGMGVVFFFHGLMDGSTNPARYFATNFGLQDVADETNTVIVLPESQLMSLAGFSFYMWDAMEQGDEDVVLYDDLRTCVGTELDVDLSRLSAMGFSGGALFSTTIMRERGDTLAAVASMSGGADAEVPTFDELTSRYDTPAYQMPVLVVSGGDEDVWPGGGLVVIDFDAASDTLEEHLVEDGHFVVRCRHDYGHTITNTLYDLAQSWALEHVYGEPSPWVGATDLPDGCEISSSGSAE